MSLGIGGHQSPVAQKDEWITPRNIPKALGSFDLDPCQAVNQPWLFANKGYTIHDDGLNRQWKGRVWMNPPYGRETANWLAKLADHGNGIALIFARTETKMFFSYVWNKADAVFFFEGRLTFHHVTGQKASANSGAPSCLVAYGGSNCDAISSSGLPGHLVLLDQPTSSR